MSVGVVPREFAVTVDVIDCDSGSIVNGIDCDSGSGGSADNGKVEVDGNDVDTAGINGNSIRHIRTNQ